MKLRELKKHKISIVLLITVLLGVISTAFDFSDTERIIHLTGEKGHTLNYAFFFIFQYLIGFVLIGMLLVKERTQVDKWIVINYLWWDFVGFLSYLYQGWPEPKMLIVLCFCSTIVIFLGLQIFRND